ncbi:2-oxoacid:ferredoxin oxidoreductase subunit beta [Bacillus sp. ISL-47]|uniref:2-oxoacid:ferredoxin oxidoreductase subunit beta n=1 Tax=Bacillus sp. ISL-47 TaxID=2819130 RepID=UPI001BEBF40E|nr:2-oxoacid:ferredoxin oxidoreductase subunit beta [Bacillus sp. ISL-47]MBT2689849.1 2-oxoacid:ferredoxin oxidoreductase subunit beta [Bacillus sp. ISL-47]MBT2710226.1 2-oxoacid:ferredoxin oxidoreductase subunit beta [Pseudomonas sp. ISL-84]
MTTLKDYRVDIKPNWCPGCGDFSVLAAIQRAAVNLKIEPEDFVLQSGIGCSGRISGYLNVYGMHSMHGRALGLAQGVKLANKNLTVVCAGGDGDGFGIGLNHFVHAARRNIDITYIVMDNQIYGLTKGQMSPTSPKGFLTKSTPEGNPESPVSPIHVALSSNASFIAQGFSGNLKQITSLIEQGIQHKGFSFINIFSPCVTFNKVFTYDWFKQNLINLDNENDYDVSNRSLAFEKVEQTNGFITGVIYRKERKEFTESLPGNSGKSSLIDQNLSVNKSDIHNLLSRYM